MEMEHRKCFTMILVYCSFQFTGLTRHLDIALLVLFKLNFRLDSLPLQYDVSKVMAVDINNIVRGRASWLYFDAV